MKPEELEAAAMQLQPDARARLAQKLLESLDEPSAIRQQWVEEAKRRDKAADAGESVGRDFDVAMRDAQARLG